MPLATKASDLPMRVLSAAVMMAIAIAAIVAGDPWLDLFIAAVVIVTLAEFYRLVLKAPFGIVGKGVGLFAGTIYIALAGLILNALPVPMIIGVIGSVIFVDSFAYAFGRTLGGPKIAPKISPSKTWAGLLGGVVGSSLWLGIFVYVAARQVSGANTLGFEAGELGTLVLMGAAIAVAAQSGDFFESWLKRKAGVKDSSNLIPGHGGFFDRTDGIIPVVLLAGLFLNVMR
ncbi:phosphatidate cytidylyltransferase [Qipengyuania sp. 1NDH17]|uniref:Phosphatidate cytidylyltransferase n=1 Tax=Qipengyuania polymorpha TaxID=2867234 RepID=A0ABS7IU60_9SPHN|nr:phosphatidate cytidylyltransferase [Qipengyuania polymorpha]MBX7456919.1 phosphatidate cytidylyltransferase [Qipengyuania polymorpha]